MDDSKKNGSAFDSADQLKQAIDRYFAEHLPSSGEIADIESLADYLGTTREELLSMMSDKKAGPILRLARNKIAKIKKQLAFGGKIPATVFTFDLKNNHGYKDKPEDADTNPHETVIFKGKTSVWAQ